MSNVNGRSNRRFCYRISAEVTQGFVRPKSPLLELIAKSERLFSSFLLRVALSNDSNDVFDSLLARGEPHLGLNRLRVLSETDP